MASVFRPRDLRRAEVELWRAWCDAEPAFQSPLLQPDFARVLGAVRDDTRVAIIRRDGCTIGFLPYQSGRGGYARPIGAPFSDLHALITQPHPGFEAAEALQAAGLRSYRFSGLVDPSGVFEGCATASTTGYAIDLTGRDADEHLEQLRASDPKRAKNWRRLAHKLEREKGPFALKAAADVPAEAYAALLGWKSAQLRRTGLHDVLRPTWARRLMDGLFAEHDRRFGGLCLMLYAGGTPVAGHFGVRAGDRFHPWVAAFDPAYSAYSPGTTFLWRVIQAMPGLGLAYYDLSAGHGHYKAPFANVQRQVWSGKAAAVSGRRRATIRSGWAGRVHDRLEHIAAAEPSAAGRVRGVVEALLSAPKRLAAVPEPA